jgi:hypothetical protein
VIAGTTIFLICSGSRSAQSDLIVPQIVAVVFMKNSILPDASAIALESLP